MKATQPQYPHLVQKTCLECRLAILPGFCRELTRYWIEDQEERHEDVPLHFGCVAEWLFKHAHENLPRH